MAAILTSVADAVVSAINAGTFVRSFVAERGYDVTADLEDLYGVLRVDVVPANETNRQDTRTTREYRPQIDVGVRYKFHPADEDNQGLIAVSEVDAYVELLEQINNHLLSTTYRRLPDYRSAVCVGSEIPAPWIPKDLIGIRQYTGILRMTYSVEKELA